MLITFEGPDGSGKTTQLTLLAEYLTTKGYSILRVREPGGTSIGEQIRNILHSNSNQEMHPHTEVLLYSAARAQLVAQVIRPVFEVNQLVLCDRFYDSTFAYQGYGHRLDLDTLRIITQFATGGVKPDLSIFISVDPELGLERRRKNQGAEWNRLDGLQLDFHKRVRAGYEALIQAEPERWVVIDGNRPVEEIQIDIQETVIAHAVNQDVTS